MAKRRNSTVLLWELAYEIKRRETRDRTLAGRRPADRSRYLSRRIIAWDGEGYTDDNGKHHLMLWGNSTGAHIHSPSLTSRDCLAFIVTQATLHRDAIHVIYSGSYDVNMILGNVPLAVVYHLAHHGEAQWGPYTLRYIPRKLFGVSTAEVTITIYDVFSFFACSAVKAFESYLGIKDELVERGKSGRASFTYAELPSVLAYWKQENELYVMLVERLRSYLADVGIFPSEWYGPGAVAATLYRRHGTKRALEIAPPEVRLASRHAYAGGRFELFRPGHTDQPIYAYDIRSAYPAAMLSLPKLAGGTWWHEASPADVAGFSLYHVRWEPANSAALHPHPLWWRDPTGRVFFPPRGEGWYWGVELAAALTCPWLRVSILEAWRFTAWDDTRPMAWVADMFAERKRLKATGNPAQLALKLGLNSLYGKLAQQTGYRPGGKLPPYHQLEWAGYITAATRAKLFAAMMQAPRAIVAVETDSIVSLVPLSLPETDQLGAWEAKTYDAITYVQSGFYWSRSNDKWTIRSRGITAKDLAGKHDEVMARLTTAALSAESTPPIRVDYTRFMGMKTSLGYPEWRTWQRLRKEVAILGSDSKRVHRLERCPECAHGHPMSTTLHSTLVPRHRNKIGIGDGLSMAHRIEWEVGAAPTGERPEWDRSSDDADQE